MGRKFKIIQQGDRVNDMLVVSEFRDEANDRHMLRCRCIVCGREYSIYEGNIRKSPHTYSHNLYCSRGLKQYNPNLYEIWLHMKQRIGNPNNTNYARYGGRGLDYDPRYEYYVNFFYDHYAKYMLARDANPDKKISMDRIDNNRGYWPDNIRWTTPEVQTRNSTRVREFYAVDPNGKIYLTNNQLQFAARHGLEPKHISACLLGKQATTAGWRFKEKNNLFFDMYYDQMAIRELYY